MINGDLVHPPLLRALAGARHGATVLLADGHYPASTAVGPRAEVVHLNLTPGLLDTTTVLRVLLRAVPVEAAAVMVPPPGEDEPAAVAAHVADLALHATPLPDELWPALREAGLLREDAPV